MYPLQAHHLNLHTLPNSLPPSPPIHSPEQVHSQTSSRDGDRSRRRSSIKFVTINDTFKSEKKKEGCKVVGKNQRISWSIGLRVLISKERSKMRNSPRAFNCRWFCTHGYSPILTRNTQNVDTLACFLIPGFRAFRTWKQRWKGEVTWCLETLTPHPIFCVCIHVGAHLFLPSSVKPPLSLHGTYVKRVNKKKRVETKYRSWFVPLNNYGRCIHTAFRSISIFSYRRQENAQIRSKRM